PKWRLREAPENAADEPVVDGRVALQERIAPECGDVGRDQHMLPPRVLRPRPIPGRRESERGALLAEVVERERLAAFALRAGERHRVAVIAALGRGLEQDAAVEDRLDPLGAHLDLAVPQLEEAFPLV